MKNLFDTSTIFGELNCNEKLFNVAWYCKLIQEPFTISSEIEAELRQPLGMSDEELIADVGHISGYIKNGLIKYINISTNETIKKNYDNIRKRYYGWMTRAEYCKALINKGDITKEDYTSKGFRYKDAGECSLIAIALTSPGDFTIISEDKGRVYCHPSINIFDKFKDRGITVVKYREWAHYDSANEIKIDQPLLSQI